MNRVIAESGSADQLISEIEEREYRSPRSRMKRRWRLIRARRRSSSFSESVAVATGSFYSTDRYQMCLYVG
jgi:hypothetical protein